jgi:Xaa-Pro aminopeptidase
MKISADEHAERRQRLLYNLLKTDLSGVVLFDSYYILYYSGFAFIPTERPIAFLMNAAGESALFVPRLELEHAQANAAVGQVDHYLEYPFKPHPMELLGGRLARMGIAGRFGADQDGYPWIFGYRGPRLGEVAGQAPFPIASYVEDQMMIKSPAELALIRESVKWGHLAHVLLQRYTRVGATETEASQRASAEAHHALLDTIGPLYRSLSLYEEGASAGYRGQIGRNAAIPHSLAGNLVFQAGDVLVTGANAPVWGYNSELERTLVVGPPSDRQAHMFAHMLALQQTALDSLRPGAKCSDVDRAVRAYFENYDLMPYWKHHSGHAIGLRYHEAPFLDLGDNTEIRPGMVFTVEPGLYVPDLGGFRHSDTVVVTPDGIEILTYYPRDLDNLTIPL